MVTVLLFHTLLIASRNKEFLWRERPQEGSYVVERTFRHLESSCGNIQECRTAFILVECQAGNVVVLLLLQKLLAEGYAGSHQFGDASLDYLLCELRILQLVTHCHLVARTHKSRKVSLEGVMRESCHRNGTGSRAGTLCKDDAEHLAGGQGIISICFIKIAAPEQKHCLRMFRLHGEKLLHHRCFGRFLFCHFIFFYIKANLQIFPQT